MSNESRLRRNIRAAIIITILGLIGSGLSSFPLLTELNIALHFKHMLPSMFKEWFVNVKQAVKYNHDTYPLMLYGYDWLGFSHFFIAMAFIGPLQDPVKNQWVVRWGMLVSGITILIALVAERFRDIPFFWSMIDALIGAGALLILWICNRWINELKALPK